MRQGIEIGCLFFRASLTARIFVPVRDGGDTLDLLFSEVGVVGA